MVPIGRNVMCTELTIELVMNRYFGYNPDEDKKVFNETEMFKANFGTGKKIF